MHGPRIGALMLAVVTACCALVVTPSIGQAEESPRSVMLELHGGAYLPQIDSGFQDSDGVSRPPYAYGEIFEESSMTMLGIFMDYQVFQGAGTLGVGVGARYGWVDGKALTLDGGTSSDEVGMNLVPLTLSLTYRFDLAQNELGLPLVPYVKGGLTYALWWFTDGKNDISVSDADGTSGAGGTFGWHGGGGLQLLLDFFAPSMAQDFEQDVGVNNSYLFVEVMVNQINDFGSATSINLGDTTLSFGLMLEI